MKFRASSFSVCIKTDSEGQFIVSDMSEILSFPHKFSCQNIDYVKLTNIQINKQGNVLVRRILGNYKQLLVEVFKISRISKVSVRVISRSRIVLLYIERKKKEVMFLLLH